MTGDQNESGRGVSRSRAGVAGVGSLVLHTVVGSVLLFGPRPDPISTMPVYSVELVAAPRPAERPAPRTVERPAQPRPTPPSEPPRRRTSQAEEAPPPPPEPEVEREPAPRTTPEEPVEPEDEPSTGTDVTTIKTEGVRFPYPEYLRNIVAQVYRRWRRPSANTPLRAEVMFFVHRDGSVSNIQFVNRSGNFSFDLEAQGAIEAAGNAQAFGPLPEGYPSDILPVSFFFDPGTFR